MHWHRIAAVNDCPPGTCREAVAGDHVVALFNVDGQFYALDGVCPHQGGPLGQGRWKDVSSLVPGTDGSSTFALAATNSTAT